MTVPGYVPRIGDDLHRVTDSVRHLYQNAIGGDTALTDLGISDFAQTILDDTTAAEVRTTIGAGIGSISLETVQTGTSGRTVLFSDVPSGIKKITVLIQGATINGTTDLMRIRIGPVGGLVDANYSSIAANNPGAAGLTSTIWFILAAGNMGSGAVLDGIVHLYNFNSSDTWMMEGKLYSRTSATSPQMQFSFGRVAIGGALTQFEVGITGTTDSFSNYSFGAQYYY